MIDYAQQQGIAVITMAHGKVNAMDLEFCRTLSERCQQLRQNKDQPRAVVLTGTRSTFSAGVDLQRVVSGGMSYLDEFLPALDQAFADLLSLEVPLIVALNGHAIGGGAVMAACADRVIAGPPSLRIGLPELSLGVPLPLTGLEAVRLTLGAAANEVILGAHVTALSDSPWAGVVHSSASPDELLDAAVEVAVTLTASGNPGAFAATKRQLRRPLLDRIRQSAAGDRDASRDIWEERLESGAIARFLEGVSR